jgi:hypothetical protein
MRFATLFVSGLLVSGLFAAPPVHAHGDSPSLEAEVGDYLIDIGYAGLSAGEPIEFDLDLFTKGPPVEFADFASVVVRVTRDGAEIVSGSVENDGTNIPAFHVTFPEPGGYDMDVRYLDDADALIAARTFHVEIPDGATVMLRDGEDALHYVLAAGLFALSFGIAGYALWERYGPKK